MGQSKWSSTVLAEEHARVSREHDKAVLDDCAEGLMEVLVPYLVIEPLVCNDPEP